MDKKILLLAMDNGLLLPVLIGVVFFVALVGVGLLLYFFVLKKKQLAAGQGPPNLQVPQQPLPAKKPQIAGAENAGMQSQSSGNRPAPFSFNHPKSKEMFAEQKPVVGIEQPKSGVFGSGLVPGALPAPLQPFGGLSPEEESDVKSLVAVLSPEKQNYSSDQIMLVVLEKGYSKKVADEIIRRIYG